VGQSLSLKLSVHRARGEKIDSAKQLGMHRF